MGLATELDGEGAGAGRTTAWVVRRERDGMSKHRGQLAVGGGTPALDITAPGQEIVAASRREVFAH